MHPSTNYSVLFVSVASVSDSTQRQTVSLRTKYFRTRKESLTIGTIITRSLLTIFFSKSSPWFLLDHWSSYAWLPSVQHGSKDALARNLGANIRKRHSTGSVGRSKSQTLQKTLKRTWDHQEEGETFPDWGLTGTPADTATFYQELVHAPSGSQRERRNNFITRPGKRPRRHQEFRETTTQTLVFPGIPRVLSKQPGFIWQCQPATVALCISSRINR